jgi:hypothetical protein
MVSRRARPLLAVVDGGVTRLDEGVDEAEAEVEAEAKRVSRVTLLLGVGAGEVAGMSLENNFSRSDVAPLIGAVED